MIAEASLPAAALCLHYLGSYNMASLTNLGSLGGWAEAESKASHTTWPAPFTGAGWVELPAVMFLWLLGWCFLLCSRIPQALQRVLGPSGPLRHWGDSDVPQSWHCVDVEGTACLLQTRLATLAWKSLSLLGSDVVSLDRFLDLASDGFMLQHTVPSAMVYNLRLASHQGHDMPVYCNSLLPCKSLS